MDGTAQAQMDQSALDLFNRNMSAFERYEPLLHEKLRTIAAPASRIVGSVAGGDLNLDLGHTLFYETDAVTFARRQVEEFVQKPSRFLSAHPPRNPSPQAHHSDRFGGKLTDHLLERGAKLTARPDPDTGFILIFGVGLGLHIPMLMEKLQFRNIFLIEQHLEFIYHSLSIVDWEAVFVGIEERNGRITFVIKDAPDTIDSIVYWAMRNRDFGLIDGTYLYRHYSSFLLDESFRRFWDRLPTLSYSAGYYEDELVMLSNAFDNLFLHDWSFLDRTPQHERRVPALVVASGPSLDSSIELLRKFRNRVVLFCCGTTLKVLLEAGIVPDFQCELENGAETFEYLSDLTKEYDLSDITLITSVTVDPRVRPLFKEAVYYWRPGLCSSKFFGHSYETLLHVAPTVANLGMRLAILTGFKEIYLFGVDFGARDPAVHHSKSSIWLADEEWKEYYEQCETEMMSVIPANFGGRVHTNRVLEWALACASTMMALIGHDVSVYNCSDGGRIFGTIPKLPSTVSITVSPEAVQHTLDDIKAWFTPVPAQQMTPREDIAEARERSARWYDQVLAMVSEYKESRPHDIYSLYDRIDAMVRDAGFDGEETDFYDQTIHAIHVGTMMMFFQFAYYFHRRIADPEGRQPFLEFFADALRDHVREMRDTTLALLDRFSAAFDEANA